MPHCIHGLSRQPRLPRQMHGQAPLIPWTRKITVPPQQASQLTRRLLGTVLHQPHKQRQWRHLERKPHIQRAHRGDAGGIAVAQPKRIAAGRLHRAACVRDPTMQRQDACFKDSRSGHVSETARTSQPSPPAKRCITRKRTQEDLTVQLHGKRLRNSMPFEATPLPKASEKDWRRREEKRQAAVLAIKASLEYQELLSSRARGEPGVDVVPGTPDPIDHTTSKRAWEASVMQWRNALKEWGAGRAQLPS
mmetsp:Transcript_121105/g.241237  ORF Transcript_121105/g.241237 Transcript_121105/m.241237 type:complete len:249 (-) Transcript_121105:169-915(-)